MLPSHRERLLKEFARVFETTQGSGGTAWNRVLDTPWRGLENKGQNILSIIEGTESYIKVVSPNALDRSLEVDLHTLCYVPLGTTMRSGANNVLADIEEIVQANFTWAGLAYSTEMTANSIERDDQGDRKVEVTVFLNVKYRTRLDDPRS